jgi:hypothetical protein
MRPRRRWQLAVGAVCLGIAIWNSAAFSSHARTPQLVGGVASPSGAAALRGAHGGEPDGTSAPSPPPAVPSGRRRVASKWAPATDVVRGTVVVVASFGEDESWLAEQPFPYVVMSKTLPAGAPNSVAINKAQEADAYIAFILQNYDDLPPRMIFCHNHNIAWHIDGVCVAAAGSTWLCM